jgi:hypothetical protein
MRSALLCHRFRAKEAWCEVCSLERPVRYVVLKLFVNLAREKGVLFS